ncbi:MAG: hypothetical protein NTZ65_04715 [Candidatus Berkelbacteria bacterium]|nr:hypothetical protein [Candidatus Berkelbacteria bacterium]
MSKKFLIAAIILIIILALGFIWYKAKQNNQLIGGDRDSHGCIGSAGYSWCEQKSKCLRTWEEACE